LLHRPQWLRLLSKLISQPVAKVPSQSARLPLHAVTRHIPMSHPNDWTVRAMTGPSVHAVVHDPQCAMSLPTFVSQPGAPGSQSANGAMHVEPQTPPVQLGIEFGADGHAFGHVPQCKGSLATAVSHPGAAASQSAKPVLQL
jgi:hypothetical protein